MNGQLKALLRAVVVGAVALTAGCASGVDEELLS